jgi:hypothetical protein
MTVNEEALQRILKIQRVNDAAGIVIVPSISWLLATLVIPSGGVTWWIIFLLSCFALAKPYLKATLSLTSVFVVWTMRDKLMEEDVEIEEEGEEEELITKITFTIEDQPDNPIGKYMDIDFYEWLDLKGSDGIVKRYKFFGTVDISRDFTLRTDCILIPPGILYQVEA